MTAWDSSDMLGNLDKVRDTIHTAAADGLRLAGEHILGEARDHAPHEEGTLERSGGTRTDEQQLRTVVYFDGPYAVKQHEELDYRHDAGRTAKYLENALNGERDTATKIVATQLARKIEG